MNREKKYAGRCAWVELVRRNRKYRWSQTSHRNGLISRSAETILSITPLRRDLRTRSLPQIGQFLSSRNCIKPTEPPSFARGQQCNSAFRLQGIQKSLYPPVLKKTGVAGSRKGRQPRMVPNETVSIRKRSAARIGSAAASPRLRRSSRTDCSAHDH